MPKYHIAASGQPAVCEATIRCRLSDSDGNPSPHSYFESVDEARSWAETQMAAQYGLLGQGVETEEAEVSMSPREIREAIARAEEARGRWQGGDTEAAAERTRANRAEQDEIISKLESMLPEGEPASALALRHKVLWNEGGKASSEEMREYLAEYQGGYISDREAAERRGVMSRLAQAEGFEVGRAEAQGPVLVNSLGNGWTLERDEASRSWGRRIVIRDEKHRIVKDVQRVATMSDADALESVGEYLHYHPEVKLTGKA